MRARIRPGVRLRKEDFGGVCYVPHRDDFFALAGSEYALLSTLTDSFTEVSGELRNAFRKLAELGIVETERPSIQERQYSGPSLIGQFPELPSVQHPLVVNCFSTAHCPLICQYCHADDLMTPELRAQETDDDVANVLSTATAIPAMVGVITGGDPLTRPVRARRLIEGLSASKSLVLDTSGVGPFDQLLESIKTHRVHVRVSLDYVSARDNTKLRPENRLYVNERDASRWGAQRTIEACLKESIPVTVQTVVSSFNENEDLWIQLRDWLVSVGVRHWVLHAAVAGGKARQYEQARRSGLRQKHLIPSPDVYSRLWAFVKQTIEADIPIDVRCTDTGQAPNSVLLIGSNGDLYTEGYARKGKVLLFSAGAGRPDTVNSLMTHVDRFGHARRYLNWNQWFFDQASIEQIGVRLDLPKAVAPRRDRLVETELKCRVSDVRGAWARLRNAGFRAGRVRLQRDEYFDTADRALKRVDWVVRLRTEPTNAMFAVKGQRFYSGDSSNSRLEVEVPVGHAPAVRKYLRAGGFLPTWFFEKRRVDFRSKSVPVTVSFDEVPELGWFVEIEGSAESISTIVDALAGTLGARERENYKDLFLAHSRAKGLDESLVQGAEFRRGRGRTAKAVTGVD